MADTRNIFPDLKQNFTRTSSGSEICSYTSDLGPDTPILTLIHGYPQSAFEWRYTIPVLSKRISLFIPELPGYGVSTPTTDHSKRGVGAALLEALEKVFGASASNPRKVILGGHDRGARICHRLAVDKHDYPALQVLGAIILDIVPTKVQWEAFANPLVAAGCFHWPLLANVEISVPMIKAYGGANWCRGANMRIAGTDEGREKIKADGALELYAALFDREDVLKYSSEDYAAGARIDVQQQTEDQKAGRKIDVPTLVMFSKAGIGSKIDCEKAWRDWINDGVPYEGIAVGDGHGHYLPEEATDTVLEAVTKFLDKYA